MDIIRLLFGGDSTATWWFRHYGIPAAAKPVAPHESLARDSSSQLVQVPSNASDMYYPRKSQFLADYVNCFYQAGVFDSWRTRLQAKPGDALPPPTVEEAARFNRCFHGFTSILNPTASSQYFQNSESHGPGYFEALMLRLMNLTPSELQTYDRFKHFVSDILKDTPKLIKNVAKRMNSDKYKELLEFRLALQLLKAPVLASQLAGASMLDDLCSAASRYSRSVYGAYYYPSTDNVNVNGPRRTLWMKPRWLCDQLLEEHVLDVILGTQRQPPDGTHSSHLPDRVEALDSSTEGSESKAVVEDDALAAAASKSQDLLRRAVPILSFLAKYDKLDTSSVMKLLDIVCSSLNVPGASAEQQVRWTTASCNAVALIPL